MAVVLACACGGARRAEPASTTGVASAPLRNDRRGPGSFRFIGGSFLVVECAHPWYAAPDLDRATAHGPTLAPPTGECDSSGGVADDTVRLLRADDGVPDVRRRLRRSGMLAWAHRPGIGMKARVAKRSRRSPSRDAASLLKRLRQ